LVKSTMYFFLAMFGNSFHSSGHSKIHSITIGLTEY
jgi:hypothetical protein